MSISENERYWQHHTQRAEERAERAEAECERLRDALECLVAEQNDAPLERHREEWERAMRKAQEALDAPHPPEQTTHKWEPPSVLSEIWPDIEDDEPQQAHGEARSGVPYVPEESPELIESMQAAFSKAGGFNTPSAMRSVLRAVAAAPSDGGE